VAWLPAGPLELGVRRRKHVREKAVGCARGEVVEGSFRELSELAVDQDVVLDDDRPRLHEARLGNQSASNLEMTRRASARRLRLVVALDANRKTVDGLDEGHAIQQASLGETALHALATAGRTRQVDAQDRDSDANDRRDGAWFAAVPAWNHRNG
jgi:hypothetical protein